MSNSCCHSFLSFIIYRRILSNNYDSLLLYDKLNRPDGIYISKHIGVSLPTATLLRNTPVVAIRYSM